MTTKELHTFLSNCECANITIPKDVIFKLEERYWRGIVPIEMQVATTLIYCSGMGDVTITH